jgi:hypothetical protein
MGKRTVEKAAAWKSPTPGLSHSAWKSRNSGGISHFSHRPDYGGFIGSMVRGQKIAELRRTRLVYVCQNID